jgi:hypothetical protein
LDDLPEELVVLILDRLDGGLIRCQSSNDRWRYYEAFKSLCLTSRKFNRLAKPYLHATIINFSLCNEYAAIDRLVLNPNMSDGIKRICWTMPTYRPGHRYGDAMKSIELKFSQRHGRLGIPGWLAASLRLGFYGTEFADRLTVILVLTRNVEYLQVRTPYPNYGSEVSTWLKLLSLSTSSSASGLCEHFRHLHHVRLDMERYNPEQIGPLLRLQSLRILHIENAMQNGYEIPFRFWDQTVVGKQCSALENLLFENSRINSDAIVYILGAIRNLKALKLGLGLISQCQSELCALGECRTPFRTTLRQALAAHKDSLERLYIINRPSLDEVDNDTHHEDENFLSGLHDLRHLRYLDIGITPFRKNAASDYFRGIDFSEMLSASLEQLVIAVENVKELLYDDSLRTILLDLATVCELRTPLLKGIVVWLPQQQEELFTLDLAACKAAFQQLGVELNVMCRYEGVWQLHPSITEASPLHDSDKPVYRHVHAQVSLGFRRPPYKFQGACSAYHHPYAWSIVDNL